ncbi:MAG: NUMOD3 domain-containing DNA-binding protein [Saccharofermentanales bacterium]
MEIFINDKLLIKRVKFKNIYEYHLSNGEIVKTKDIEYFNVKCRDCGKYVKLLNYPTTTKDYYECGTCRQVGEKNPMYGKTFSDEWKKQRSIKYTGEKNPMYNKSVYDVWVEKYGKNKADKMLDKFKLKMSSVTKGDKNGMYNKTYYDVWVEKYGEKIANEKNDKLRKKHKDWLLGNMEHHKTMIINSHKNRYRKTSIEKEVESFLIDNNINYKYNHIDKFQYDFLLEKYNIIIEVQGDYWHANPLYYSDNDKNLKPLNETQKYKVKLDKDKNNYIKNKYNIIYLWETDIKNKKYKEILWNLLKLKE